MSDAEIRRCRKSAFFTQTSHTHHRYFIGNDENRFTNIRGIWMKKIIAVAAVVFAAVLVHPAFACIPDFTLIDSDGHETILDIENPVELDAGRDYTLRIEYWEDHRNCSAKPEETMFLLDGARWRVGRETQPLVLSAAPEWTRPAARTNVGELRFTAVNPGEWILEIIRVCDRGGYSGQIEFHVS